MLSAQANAVRILSADEGERISLFRPEGAKPHASHLAIICAKADKECRFFSTEELDTLTYEPGIAAGVGAL